MAGARGDALDWALALARAPVERHALRERPLPEGIEELLQIAAGNQRGAALQAAIARTGESEVELVEIVRFYLREVLFHAQADAYRVLGLTPAADSAQIKAHHRLLQQWLHPDRQTSDWDAIFSSRVNVAWDALRSPERRARYDATQPVAVATRAVPQWAGHRVVGVDAIANDEPASRWRRRAPVLALFAACGLLGVAAVRDALRAPDGVSDIAITPAASAPQADAISLQLPRARRTVPQKEARQKGVQATRPMAMRPTETRPIDTRPTHTLGATSAAPRVSRIAEPALAASPTPIPQEIDIRTRAPPAAALSSPVTARQGQGTPVVAIQPAAVNLPSSDSGKDVAAPARPAPLPAVASAPTPPAGAGMPANVPVATSDVTASVSPEHVRGAQDTGRQLIAFLAARDAKAPPIWDSLAAQQRALRLRDALHANKERLAGDPQWRVGRDEAGLRVLFGSSTVVRSEMVWRDQRWLVRSIATEIRQ